MPLNPEQLRLKKKLERDVLTQPNADKYGQLAELYYIEGNWEKAIKYYQKVIAIKPDNAEAHNNLGGLYANTDRTKEAETAYKKAIEINPNYAATHNNLGNLYANTDRPKEAESAYKKAIEINPNLAEAHNNLGLLYANTDRPKEAEIVYKKVIEINPNLAEAHNNLGGLYFKTDRTKEAESAYKKAIEINPNYAKAHNNLGILYKDTDRTKEAEITYKKALAINPNYAEAHNNLGVLYADTDRLKEAESAYKKAIEINPNYAKAHYNLGNLYADTDRPKEAEIAYKKAIEINPNHAEAYGNLGNLYKDTDRPNEAETAYKKAIELAVRDYHAYLGLCVLYASLGDIEQMKHYYNLAAEIEPQLRNEEFEQENDIKRPAETLSLRNFGAIQSLDNIEIKRFTVFIGKSGAGKSTVAKLLAILGSLKAFWNGNRDIAALQAEWYRQLAIYELSDYLQADTYLRWQQGAWHFELKDGQLSASEPIPFNRPTVYIPAERAFSAMASGVMNNLLLNDVPISRTLLEFGALFEKSRAHFKQYDLPLLGIDYHYKNGLDYIQPKGTERFMLLRQSASSHQAVVPMYMNMAYCRSQNGQNLFVIEEPELNLYSPTQKQFIEYVVETALFARPNNQVIVTTHSPYIIMAINNLIQAFETFLRKPEKDQEITALVPTEQWLRFEEVSAYYMDNGTARNIMNKEYRIISDSDIDAGSDVTNEIYSKLLKIKYPHSDEE
jgi:tetratricopeptide (TPR) repeat protein